MSDEIFGPILPIFTIKSLDEAMRFINTRYNPINQLTECWREGESALGG
jgi:acyl-CoA reductase-like NAD-dependent aldehyde dehydrogenase